jgi:hypothetical protein
MQDGTLVFSESLSRLINGALILELSEPKIILQNLDPSYR